MRASASVAPFRIEVIITAPFRKLLFGDTNLEFRHKWVIEVIWIPDISAIAATTHKVRVGHRSHLRCEWIDNWHARFY